MGLLLGWMSGRVLGQYDMLIIVDEYRDDQEIVYYVGHNVIGFEMYVKAVEKAGSTDVDAVRKAMYGIKVPNLTGGTAEMLPNHHLSKPVLIGEIKADGQFDIISQTEEVLSLIHI